MEQNRGIGSASEHYISFIDSDDYFDNDFIAKDVDKLNQGFDCVVFDHILFNSSNEQIYWSDINPLGSNMMQLITQLGIRCTILNYWQEIRFLEHVLI